MALISPRVEKVLLELTEKLASNKHLNALKDGFAYAMPFIIIGSLILVLTNLPFTDQNSGIYWRWYAEFMAAHKGQIVQPFYVSMSLLSIYVAFGIGYSLSQQYKLPAATGGLVSIFAFLVVGAPSDWITLMDAKWGLEAGAGLPVLDARFLDSKGLFTAILTSFFAVHVYRIMLKKKLVFTLPDSVPPALAKSFEIILPIAVIAIVLQSVNIVFATFDAYSLPNAIMLWIGAPLTALSDNLISVIILTLIIHLLWLFGLHGANIVMAIITPVLLTNIQMNIDAVQAGYIPERIFAYGFFDYFVHLGGSGATLGLCLLLMFSRHIHFNKIGKIAIVPSIFNINEPIIFGVPIVGNPILAIPFVGVPVINTTLAWFALKSDLIPKITAIAPWTMPAPISAFIGTQSFLATVLSLCLIILSILLYLPFFRMYERTVDELNKK